MPKTTTIAVASGKGGAGKTTVAVSLALTAPGSVRLLDCDVEEPDAGLFLKPAIFRSACVNIPVPEIDAEKCRHGGACARACQFGAVVMLGGRPHVFPELCKGCGGCFRACAFDAIREVERPVGVVEEGEARGVGVVQGRMNVGETATPRVIRAVRKIGSEASWTLVDAPPGASCAMTAAVRGADYALLVAEPTPFGLHDLGLAAEAARRLSVPFGVVVNRHTPGNRLARDFCARENISLLAEIPDERRIAEALSRGERVVETFAAFRGLFVTLWKLVAKEAA